MKKRLFAWLAMLLMLFANTAFAEENTASAAGDFSALAGKRIGVQTGTVCGPIVEKCIPDAKISYFNSQTDTLAALKAGKVDYWCAEKASLRFLMLEYDGFRILDGQLGDSPLAAIFPKTEKGQALRDQYSAFVDRLWADGTMDEIDAVWFGADESKRMVPDYESLPDTNGTLRMALDTSILPFAYVKDNRIVGYDVDIAARFCREYGYRLQPVPMSFDGVLASVQSGKCDFASTGITITEERAESVLFSSPNYHSSILLACLDSSDGSSALSGLNGKRIGVQNGTTFDKIVLESLPDAEISYFNTFPDMAAALEADKIDAFPGDEPVIRLMISENPKLEMLDGRLNSFDFGIAVPKTEKGKTLLAEMNAWLASMKESGETDRLITKWTEGPEEEKTVPDYAAIPAAKGVLRMATEGGYAPMAYYRGDELIGLEIELAALFCADRGYGLSIEAMNFDGILPALQSGKADFAMAGMTITEERKESVYFSDPYYTGGTVLAVLKSGAGLGGGEFWDSIAQSFNKTFIRENRWQLFLYGVGVTLLITVLSALLGTGLGFAGFMVCRNGNRIANALTRFFTWLIQGMPMVVLLMVLYYIVFGKTSIKGISVSVIGFTLTFGASVFGLLKMGVGAVDIGQYEAAYALGYSNPRTFFRIILPQALPHVLPSYKGEIVNLIKATSIVGYIAVQDLTRMGDIVRSRTYEAFFPLIAVTVIYFALEALLGYLVGKIEINYNPKRRKAKDILKGVKTDD